MLKEFRAFILRGNLVDLAVAVVVGAAFTALVNSLVENLITPLIAAVAGEPDFGRLAFEINGSRFGYGEFLNALLTFLLVSAVLFFLVIKPVNLVLERLRLAERAVPAPSPELAVLTEIRDLLRDEAHPGPSAPP
jgi:large conductance mechanosensitive channel